MSTINKKGGTMNEHINGILVVLWTTVLAIAALLLTSCGSTVSTTNSGDDGGTSFTTLSDLPRATSPMADGAAASVLKNVNKAATVGLGITTVTQSDFDANSSMGGCEMFNLVKEGVASAAQADQILCYVASMNAQESFADLVDSEGSAINIYDGAWHIFNLNITGEEEEEGGGAPSRVKMKIVKDADGSIVDFTMFMCAETEAGLAQNEYTKQVIDGTSLVMRAIGRAVERSRELGG